MPSYLSVVGSVSYVGRAMLVIRCEPRIVLNPDDPLRYGVIFFRLYDVDSTT
jgi:hypothetical protein